MRRILSLFAVTVLMVALMAAPAMAAPQGGPVVTGGLVNVTIVDAVDVNDVTVQLPIAAALNVCNIDIVSLTVDSVTGERSCTADADSRANN